LGKLGPCACLQSFGSQVVYSDVHAHRVWQCASEMYVFACMRCAVYGYWSPETCQDTRSARHRRADKRSQTSGRARSSCCDSEGAGQPETRHSSAEVPARGSHIQTNAALPATTSAPPVHLTHLSGAAPCGGCPAGPGRHSAESGAGCAGKVACASAQVSVMLVSRCSSAGASAVPTRTWLRAQASREPPARQAHTNTLFLYPIIHTSPQCRRHRHAVRHGGRSTRAGCVRLSKRSAHSGHAASRVPQAPAAAARLTEPGTW